MQEVLFAPNNDMLLQSNHVNSNSVRVDIIINNADMLQLMYTNADSLSNKLSELQILSHMEGYDVTRKHMS